MNTKKFSPGLHRMCDKASKDAVISYFKEKLGMDAKENPDRYGVDIILGNNETIDVQVRQHWSDPDEAFPFQEIHVPVRNFAKSANQKILLDNGNIVYKAKSEMPTYYCVLRSDFKRALIFQRDDILSNSRLDKVYIKSMGTHDTFFSIDQKFGKYIDLTITRFKTGE